MALFSNFCNICYKIDDESLQEISEVNMKYLNDILITFVGHVDIINYNVIYLCQLCCEELTRVDKFREICLTNLIQMRQRYINMKLELEGNACAVQNTLQKFVYEEVLRKSSLEESNCPVSITTDFHGIIKSPEYVNKDCLVFNRQVTNLQLATNECDNNGVSSEENIKNEMLTRFENTMFEKFERESDEDFVVSDANNDNKSSTLQIEFIKEYDLKDERENIDSENYTLENDENESDEHANLDVKMPVVYNSGGSVSSGIAFTKEELNVKQENSDSKDLELQTMEDVFGDGLNVTFQIANVSTIVNMEERGHGNIRSEDTKGGMKLQNRVSNSTLTAATTDALSNPPHVREYRNRVCSKTLQSDARKRIYPSVEAHTCTVCNNTFRNSSGLTRHERAHTGDRPYKCTVCNKTFTELSNLTVHERIHSGDRPYKCTVCNKSFTNSSHLSRHKRIHSGDRPYKCIVCNKAFTQASHLSTHKRIHSGDRPYKCTVCNKTFADLSSLIRHERIHSGDRPYKCNVCNKTFADKSNFISHKRIHSGDMPYKCTVCNKMFTESSHLSRHKRIHSADRPYKCIVCNKTFKQSSSLTRHKRIHNGDGIQMTL